ncbi:MAG: hypothetical protein SFY66_09015 [Oculatellaceae cyanobacterium bins.114]|nr:hypothetical protein [Oculatellaceae cyanobacterium bins.114]
MGTSLLANTWNSLNLPRLPDEFNWEQISKRYLRKVRAIAQASEELQAVFAVQAQTLTAEGVQQLVGIPPNFDLIPITRNRGSGIVAQGV